MTIHVGISVELWLNVQMLYQVPVANHLALLVYRTPIEKSWLTKDCMITNLPNIISPLFCNYINLENLNYERLLHNFNIDDFSSLSELIGHMQHSQCINNPVNHFNFLGEGLCFFHDQNSRETNIRRS